LGWSRFISFTAGSLAKVISLSVAEITTSPSSIPLNKLRVSDFVNFANFARIYTIYSFPTLIVFRSMKTCAVPKIAISKFSASKNYLSIIGATTISLRNMMTVNMILLLPSKFPYRVYSITMKQAIEKWCKAP